jgi:hypothetical protein
MNAREKQIKRVRKAISSHEMEEKRLSNIDRRLSEITDVEIQFSLSVLGRRKLELQAELSRLLADTP